MVYCYCKDFTPPKKRTEHWKIYISFKGKDYKYIAATREYYIGHGIWETVDDISIIPSEIKLREDSLLTLKMIHALLKSKGWYLDEDF